MASRGLCLLSGLRFLGRELVSGGSDIRSGPRLLVPQLEFLPAGLFTPRVPSCRDFSPPTIEAVRIAAPAGRSAAPCYLVGGPNRWTRATTMDTRYCRFHLPLLPSALSPAVFLNSLLSLEFFSLCCFLFAAHALRCSHTSVSARHSACQTLASVPLQARFHFCPHTFPEPGPFCTITARAVLFPPRSFRSPLALVSGPVCA